MNVKQKLKEVAKEFDLEIDFKNKFEYLVVTRREVIIRNFLGRCPDPYQVKYGNQIKKTIPSGLMKYLQSLDFKKELISPQGCVLRRKDIVEELRHAPVISDLAVKKEVKLLYKKIGNAIGNSERLTLISKPVQKDILLHEFVHELFEENNIRPKSWKWNEGLVTYVTFFVLNQHWKYEKSYKRGKDKMANIYRLYTHRVAKIMKNTKTPEERKRILVNLAKKY